MVDRSIIARRPASQRLSESIGSGPSPFPLLVLVLVITAILLLRSQEEPRSRLFGIPTSFPAQSSPVPSPAGSI
jgi:hypothetical protein